MWVKGRRNRISNECSVNLYGPEQGNVLRLRVHPVDSETGRKVWRSGFREIRVHMQVPNLAPIANAKPDK